MQKVVNIQDYKEKRLSIHVKKLAEKHESRRMECEAGEDQLMMLFRKLKEEQFKNSERES